MLVQFDTEIQLCWKWVFLFSFTLSAPPPSMKAREGKTEKKYYFPILAQEGSAFANIFYSPFSFI